ncbi:hypothetical protein GJ689_10425 [Rhodoplanes serenus]|uniref:DNA primase/polymerase bifunctional N-terminal domain-containing protein n=1 Tax=Rhodoplanes serenus TaxID=200615 RepID=A0A9X4XK80_9BRAD|nr:bifunctional DNA primase/polymerase [Rhodoplanes serenus]MTW16620.1 hypothetical protein [Rhodoplanes serenus]
MEASPFARFAPRLIAHGYNPLTIEPGKKSPGGYDRADGWRPMWKWSEWCNKPIPENILRGWSAWPDAGIGVACGFNGLVAVDIDRDDLLDVILPLLPRAHVAKRGSKGATLFYRGNAGVIRTNHFRTADGAGLLDILSHGSQTVIPPTLHPAGVEYTWTTDFMLWDLRVDELESLPDSIAEVIGEALKPFGFEAPREKPASTTSSPAALKAVAAGRAGGGASDGVSRWRRVNDAALANIPAWVLELALPKGRFQGRAYRAVAPWRASSSGRQEAKRGANLSVHPDGIVDHGTGETFTAIDLVMKALGKERDDAAQWLCGHLGLDWSALVAEGRAAGWDDVEADKAALPTFPDRTVSPAEARALIGTELDRYFGEQVPAERGAWWAQHNLVALYELEHRVIPFALASHALRHLRPEAVLIKGEPGVGKSTLVQQCVVGLVRSGLRIAYAVQSLRLAKAVAADFQKLGIDARAYRGFEKPDPETPGYLPIDDETKRDAAITMCRDVQARKAALAVGASSKHVCGSDNSEVRCPHYSVCGYNRQKIGQPDVWILPHALLAGPWPDFIPPLDVLIIDESFLGSMIGDAVAVPLESILDDHVIRHADGTVDIQDTFTLRNRRAALHRALAGLPDGAHVTAAALEAAGLYSLAAWKAIGLEWSRRPPVELYPAMPTAARNAIVAKSSDAYASVRLMVDIWTEVARVLDSGATSGSLRVQGRGDSRQLIVKPLRRLADELHGNSILMLDATPPTVEQLQNVLGCRVCVAVDQPVARSEHSYLIQVVDAPVSASKLGLLEKVDDTGSVVEQGKRAREHIHNLTCFMAALWPQKAVGFFAQKALEAEQSERRLPPNVRTGHFQGVTGLNDWSDAASVISVGRTLPAVREAEAEAAVTFCGPVAAVAADAHGRTRYRQERAYIRLAGGSAHPVDVLRHPDPHVEAVRRQACEDAVMQTLARDRALSRGAANPLVSVLIADIVLDLSVDVVVRWREMSWAWRTPAEVSRAGVLFVGWRENKRAYPGVSQDDAKHVAAVAGAFAADGSWVAFPYKESTCKRFPPNCRGRVVRYQKEGARQKPGTAVILPNGPQSPAEIHEWLEARLGCELAKLEVGRMPPDRLMFTSAWKRAQEAYANDNAANATPHWHGGVVELANDDAPLVYGGPGTAAA